MIEADREITEISDVSSRCYSDLTGVRHVHDCRRQLPPFSVPAVGLMAAAAGQCHCLNLNLLDSINAERSVKATNQIHYNY